jgi:hypothetical protein
MPIQLGHLEFFQNITVRSRAAAVVINLAVNPISFYCEHYQYDIFVNKVKFPQDLQLLEKKKKKKKKKII